MMSYDLPVSFFIIVPRVTDAAVADDVTWLTSKLLHDGVPRVTDAAVTDDDAGCVGALGRIGDPLHGLLADRRARRHRAVKADSNQFQLNSVASNKPKFHFTLLMNWELKFLSKRKVLDSLYNCQCLNLKQRETSINNIYAMNSW